MRLLVLSQSDSKTFSIKRFREESEKMGINFSHAKYSNLKLFFDKDVSKITVNDEDILDFDIYIFRSSKTKFGTSVFLNQTIKKFLELHNKRVLNLNVSLKNSSFATKIYDNMLMSSNGIPVIKSQVFTSLSMLLKEIDSLKFPLIAKSAKGSHGEGVSLIHSKDSLLDYTQNNPLPMTLLQEFIKGDEVEKADYRIVTLGNKVLGGYKKVAASGSIVTNLASGGHTQKAELSEEMIAIAEKIIKIFDIEFSGIDIILKDGKPLVLEINRSAQFEGFEEATGINLAKAIIEHLINS